MNLQCTLNRAIRFSGIGLHSGDEVGVTIKPAAVDNGITFVRRDLHGKPSVKADVNNVVSTVLCTTIGNEDCHVHTVEHLMAALHGMCIDNAVVELDAGEVPIMDGSADSFVGHIKRAGLAAQGALRKYIMVKHPICLAEGEKIAVLLPSDYFSVSYTIDFDHPVIREQSFHLKVTPRNFMNELSPARTFGFEKDVNAMHDQGLALGGSLDNAIVLGDKEVINDDGLRFDDEFVRHKMLDSIGDLSLIGSPILGHFFAYKSGHDLNTRLVKLLMNNPHCWEYITSYVPSAPKSKAPYEGSALPHPWTFNASKFLAG